MKTKNIKEKIEKFFFENPTKRLRVRQIEREARVALPSAIKYSAELEKEGILKSTEISGVRFYSADRSSKKFLLKKKFYNIKKLHESGLVDELCSKYANPVIIVFGSYSRGEDIEKSDIDLYIESSKKQNFDLDKYERLLERKIQVFNFASAYEISNKELANNIINGTILNGFLEVLK